MNELVILTHPYAVCINFTELTSSINFRIYFHIVVMVSGNDRYMIVTSCSKEEMLT